MAESKSKSSKMMGGGAGGPVYGLGFIGSLVYYVQQADGFWPVIGGILKACVWPAFVIYDLLTHIG